MRDAQTPTRLARDNRVNVQVRHVGGPMSRRLLPGLIGIGMSAATKCLLDRRSSDPNVKTQGRELLPGLIGLLATSAVGAYLDRRSSSP